MVLELTIYPILLIMERIKNIIETIINAVMSKLYTAQGFLSTTLAPYLLNILLLLLLVLAEQ